MMVFRNDFTSHRTFFLRPAYFTEEAITVALQDFIEEIQVLGRDLVDKVKSLIHEGNVRRIIVKDEHGNTFLEIPVTVAAVGAVFAPLLAALGAISALVAKFTIVVVRNEPKAHNGAEQTTTASQ
jgi:hypothetical protein